MAGKKFPVNTKLVNNTKPHLDTTAKFTFCEDPFYLYLHNPAVAELNLTQPQAQCCEG